MKRNQWTIEIPKALPSYWQFTKLHWSAKKKMIDLWHTLLLEATRGLTIKKIPTPCKVRITVYHKLSRRRDCFNMGTPADKLIFDTLSAPDGNKTRGMGFIPDDDWKNIPEVTLCLAQGEQDATVLVFKRIK
jgi:hypothetical protein